MISPLEAARGEASDTLGEQFPTSRGAVSDTLGEQPTSPEPIREPIKKNLPVEPAFRPDLPDFFERRYKRGKQRASQTDPSLKSNGGPLVRCAAEQGVYVTERRSRDGDTP